MLLKKNKDKIKILTMGDHPLVASGVGTQCKYLFEGLLKTGRYQILSLGGAIKHEDYSPQKIEPYEDDWAVVPTNGYGDENLLREILDNEEIDAVWMMTDPRFYTWLFNMSDEIRDRGVPILYFHVWDNYPVPDFNAIHYQSCDFVGCISKLTHDIVEQCGMKENSAYIPHAVDPTIFDKLPQDILKTLKAEKFGTKKGKFVVFYNSRNARRKMTSDIIKSFKTFLGRVGEDNAFLLMHTDPKDNEGSDLVAVANMLGLTADQIGFSTQRLPPEEIAIFYNVADVTINISNNEGFGLSVLESLSCGTPVIINKTGGMQDQALDDEGREFGVVIEPATRTLTGSQEVPYIFDDRCSDEDVVAALLKMFNLTETQRSDIGDAARAWTLKKFSIEDMITNWDNAISKYVKKYKESKGNPDRVRFSKI